MSRFWLVICALLAAIFVGIGMLKDPHRGYEPPLAVVLARYALLGCLVFVVWAICFRKQLESFRISIFALFMLITMEAILLGAAKILNPNLLA
jgi:hypothetical protein